MLADFFYFIAVRCWLDMDGLNMRYKNLIFLFFFFKRMDVCVPKSLERNQTLFGSGLLIVSCTGLLEC